MHRFPIGNQCNTNGFGKCCTNYTGAVSACVTTLLCRDELLPLSPQFMLHSCLASIDSPVVLSTKQLSQIRECVRNTYQTVANRGPVLSSSDADITRLVFPRSLPTELTGDFLKQLIEISDRG